MPITLDADGVGSIEFSDLVDGTIVTTENIGSNVIQFTLDPTGIYSFRNPDNSGVADERAFQIPSFQTGAHTVVYNKTHFTFNLDDPTFTGDVPTIRFQASLHSAADALPIVVNDRADITFSIAGFDDTLTPTITFNDATLDVTLDADGVGSIEFSDLVDGTIVTTENLGSNVIQFILNPAGPHNARNPNNSGVADGNEFQIPGFQTDAHTVVYNKTHFTFDFNDVTFSGSTSNVSFQANIQSDANTLPALATDLANIQFNIIGAPEICEAGVDPTTTIGFGPLILDIDSSEESFVIDNTGNMPNHVDLAADFWCDASDSTCTVVNSHMLPSRTHYGLVSGGYADKLEFADFTVGATPPPFDLFTVQAAQSFTTYLQVHTELIPEADDSPSRFTGAVTQEIWITFSCDDP